MPGLLHQTLGAQQPGNSGGRSVSVVDWCSRRRSILDLRPTIIYASIAILAFCAGVSASFCSALWVAFIV